MYIANVYLQYPGYYDMFGWKRDYWTYPNNITTTNTTTTKEFDSLLPSNPNKKPTFPFYDIVADTKNNKFYVDVALAGYSKDQLSVTEESTSITIKGAASEPPEDVKYLERNIKCKPFEISFNFDDKLKFVQAAFTDGILRLTFNVKPEYKPKEVTIE